MSSGTNLAPFLQKFFTQRLLQQKEASPHTISSYRDTFRLLLTFLEKRLRKLPSQLSLEDLDAPIIAEFLNAMERERGISARSRNLRLTAIRSFFRYVSFEAPAHMAQIQRALAIPEKRYSRAQVQFLTQPEADALLAAPDRSTLPGRRDYAFILLALQTGLRLSEMTGLKREDLCLDRGAHVRVMGKGRKERCTPLAKPTAAVMSAWVKEENHGHDGFVFPSARGARMSPDGVRYLLAKHVAVARKRCASLREKRVTPHVLRHTAAMDLLQGGVDRAVIALWLGHERVETTQIYFHANMALKKAAMAKMNPAKTKVKRFRPDDQLLAFLKAL